jgi:hypothetical protein
MTESITGFAKYGKYLVILMQKRIVVTHNNGGPPNTWPQQAFADVGTDDEFVRQLAVDFNEIMGASAIYGSRRDEINGAIMELLVDGLVPAYSHLRDIRHPSARGLGLLKRNQQIEDFTSALWRAYKTLLPKATNQLGYEIGFAFQGDSKFETGATAFNNAHPQYTEIPNYLRRQRVAWQNRLAVFRNDFIEHRNFERDEFTDYYDPKAATKLFELVSTVIGELLLVFIAANLTPQAGIERVRPEDRDPVYPRCFRWVWVSNEAAKGEGGV